MFGSKRRRTASNPPLNKSNANPSAATAAAQAFLKNQASNASLSSAAAAAALRSRPMTPTSVADVQTKRMLRRSGSTSSMGSSVAGSSRPDLERRGSNGSMSDRTFRDPSPARGVPSAIDAPPVPTIPDNIPQSKAHRRATSMEAPPLRFSSPPPNMANGRGSSLGPAGPSPRRTGQRIPSLSSVDELTGVERPASRGSVNFSYPTSSRPMSPTGHKELTYPSTSRTNSLRVTSPASQQLVYDPNTRSFLPYAELLAIEQRVQNAANKPVKKKKRIAPAQATGTHLAEGTVSGRPRGTAVDAMEAEAREKREPKPHATVTAYSPNSVLEHTPTPPPEPAIISKESRTISSPKKKKKRVVVPNDSDSEAYIPNSSDNDSDFRPEPYIRAGGLLGKKPSIVREDPEAEEAEEGLHITNIQNGLRVDTIPREVSPTPLPRSSIGRGHGKTQPVSSASYTQERQPTISTSQPAPIVQDSRPGNTYGAEEAASERSTRVQSLSPTRTTHFASSPDSLVVKHQPPPRSVSPRKSALKQQHSNSPRGLSPVGDAGLAGSSKRLSISEASNASTTGSEDLPIPRKKSVRVSFDESNVIVGEAAPQPATDSPIAPSPQQAKRSWFSMGRGKRSDASAIEEDDEVMKPRPALPSFGSVRERKNTREPVEERQLVKPPAPGGAADSDYPPTNILASAKPTSHLATNPAGGANDISLGQSYDHIVGSIISHDAASKNAANISKSREPLPPQVLSVEGSGYHSDTDSTVSGLEHYEVPDVDSTTSKPYSTTQNGHSATDKVPGPIEAEAPTQLSTEIPEISISHPTPTLEQSDRGREWLGMPGGFPESMSSSDSSSQRETTPPLVEHHPTDPTPAAIGIAEPYQGPQHGSPVLGEIAAENHQRHSTIDEETEDESIYSDAAEDLSDLEGDGFMSLNAVVESPVVPSSIPGLAISTPPDSPVTPSQENQLTKKSSQPELGEGWEKAQEYWRGLSAEKKTQKEQEALEIVEDSDSTIEAKPQPKPKKKKAAVKTAPVEVVTNQKAPTRDDRTYMIQPGTRAHQNSYAPVIRSSMRAEPQDVSSETHIRKSMRGQGSMRSSLRGSEIESRGSRQRNRPTSLPASQIKSDPVAVNMHIKALSIASASAASNAAKRDLAPKPSLQRKNSGDSDSSFKRTRPVGSSQFRSTMRRGSIDKSADGRQQSPMRSGRFSLRSLSPTDSAGGRQPFNNPQIHMRQSMRSSYDSAPTLRGSKPDRARSPMRIPGFGRSSSSKAKTQMPVRQRASRFADSSDEDEAPRTFRSRFVDSSDDDDDEPIQKPVGMRGSMRTNEPVRSIPRPIGVVDGDSSDLPDSDDEKSPASLGIKLAKSRPNGHANSNQGQTLASGSLRRSGSGRGTLASPAVDIANSRPQQNRRSSFMSILRRKKPDPSSKVRKSDIDSAARRDTPLERSRSDLQAIRKQDSYHATNGVINSSPKLQKKNATSSWPLPAPIHDDEDRPFTADDGGGVVGGEIRNVNENAGRPDLGTRRFTATGLGEVDLSNVTGKGRKKKKFQKLRNLFGLDD